ncbi:MAG TPA: DUF5777 family beta-barrel protein, partial [Acidobacteriota bacterium]|nr:DUF5777 family beta-barrel protein [Acidobacteriota bacterium]
GAWAARPDAPVPGEVKAVFQKNCAVCHKGKHPPKKLDLEPGRLPASVVDVPSTEQADLRLIDTAAPESSYLLKKILGAEGISGKRMPPPSKPALAQDELAVLENWIMGLKATGVPSADGIRNRAPGEDAGPVPAATGGQAPPSAQAGARDEDPPYWGTRLAGLPTGRTMEKGDFLLRISHRFIPSVRSGYDSFWGLDGSAAILVSLGYGITDRLGITLGRSNLFQELELSATWLVQEQGKNGALPFSVSVNGGIGWAAQAGTGRSAFNARNFKIAAQVILSRRFNRRLSVLVVPAYASNTDHWEADPEGTFAVGLGGRFMVLKDFSVIAEWVPVRAGYKEIANGWSFGIEKRIGLHVFQVFATNSIGLTSSQIVTGGDLRLGKGDFRFGFNIFRTF